MNSRQFSTSKRPMNKIAFILAAGVIAVALGISVGLYLASHGVMTPGEVHASKSPFSPVINKDNSKPEVDPFASLAKKIESNPKSSSGQSQEYTGGY